MALVAVAWAPNYVPEQALQQIFQKHKLDEAAKLRVAGTGLLTCDMLSASGETAAEFLANLKMLSSDWDL